MYITFIDNSTDSWRTYIHTTTRTYIHTTTRTCILVDILTILFYLHIWTWYVLMYMVDPGRYKANDLSR